MRRWALAAVLLCAMVSGTPAQNDDGYRVGGPLAGSERPLYPTQHGEPAGFPGHATCCTIAFFEAAEATTLKLTGGADFHLSHVQEIDSEKRLVTCVLGFTQCGNSPCADGHAGRRRGGVVRRLDERFHA